MKTIDELGGVNFWHNQQTRADYDSEDVMWGLDFMPLETIKYKGAFLVNKYSNEELWLRSDLCRLQKLLKIPTKAVMKALETRSEMNQKATMFEHVQSKCSMQKCEIEVLTKQKQELKDEVWTLKQSLR